jgi:hypothetical protein
LLYSKISVKFIDNTYIHDVLCNYVYKLIIIQLCNCRFYSICFDSSSFIMDLIWTSNLTISNKIFHNCRRYERFYLKLSEIKFGYLLYPQTKLIISKLFLLNRSYFSWSIRKYSAVREESMPSDQDKFSLL